MNIQDLRTLVPTLPKGHTLKKIRDRYYLYEQNRVEGKIVCQCLGPASDEQIAIYIDKDRVHIIKWLLKNEKNFLTALKLLTELKGKQSHDPLQP
jgi:hypothetical protein